MKGRLDDSRRLPAKSTNVTYRAAVLWKPRLFDRLGLSGEGAYNPPLDIRGVLESAKGP